MKFLNFTDYKLISPLPNTPDQLKEKFKELGNVKVNPVPLLLNEVINENGDSNQLKEKSENDGGMEPVPSSSNVTVLEHKSEACNHVKDSVEIQTVKTDDVEHGVFKRKRKI